MPALALDVHTRVCRKCFEADMVPGRQVTGFFGKTALSKTEYVCTSCGHKKPGVWTYTTINTYLDAIETGITQLDARYFASQIADVQNRVTDFLLGGGKENAHYLQQQYKYVCRLLEKQSESLLHA